MALVECRECSGQVSDLADACPHCGAPRGSAVGVDGPGSVQTVELTGRTWKQLQLLGSLGLIGGLITGVVAVVAVRPGLFPLTAVATGGGVVIWIFGRLGAWWHHG